MRFGELGEFGFINRISRGGQVDKGRVICGIGDDCAVLAEPNGRVTLVTADLMVEEVHFRIPDTEGERLGRKLLSVNLSDVAAMGGVPGEAVVSVAVPGDLEASFVEAIYKGLHACADQFGVNVVGGDTTASPGPLVMNLTLLGEMSGDQVCYRSGARAGDLVFVSGTVGDSRAGLQLLEGTATNIAQADQVFLLERHHGPTPRVALGQALAASGGVTAMIDLSDGLSSDLPHIFRGSGVCAVVQADEIPVSDALVKFCGGDRASAVSAGLAGGEDYELLFTVAADRADEVERLGERQDLPDLTKIGYVESGDPEVFLETNKGERSRLDPGRSHHFG
jgi:thiamine-monophosphate kinase